MRPRTFRYRLQLLPIALAIAGVIASLLAPIYFPAHAAPAESRQELKAGPYAIDVIPELTLHDKAREKDLSLRITYPKSGNNFPVIIFSHGAGGSKEGYAPLVRYWASYGFVCIQPTHSDSVALRRQRGERVILRGIVSDALSDSKGWVNRPRDISFIIDSLGKIEEQAPALKDKMDKKVIGVGGHSYGGFTASAIGGAAVQLPGKDQPEKLKDAHVRAILVLSGPGQGQMGLTKDSWDGLKLPAMTMTGSLDRGANRQGPVWRTDAYKFSPPGDKYLVFIEGATHFSFSGRLLQWRGQQETPQEKAIYRQIQIASLKFWQAYLKKDKEVRNYLNSDALEKDSKGITKLSRR